MYLETIRRLGGDAEQMELAFQEAARLGEAGAFAEAIDAGYAEDSGNLLYAAWHYRLAHAAARIKERAIAWSWAIPLAVLNGLLLWALSDDQRFMIQVTNPFTYQEFNVLPAVVLLAAPLSAASITLFLSLAGKSQWRRVLAVVLGLAAASAYVLFLYPRIGPRAFQEQYITLMLMQLGLLAWAVVGVTVLAGRDQAANRFAFLIKALEAFIVGGLFAIAGGLFLAITIGLFDALSVDLPNVVIRLISAGGVGFLAVLAVAVVYDPKAEPAQQAFDEGLSRLIATLMRVLLPLALLVLVVYLAFIPFNFREPFENRDVLIVYNGMLFAVIALLVGATPVTRAELGGRLQVWLRRGIIALAALALVVSLYALAAIVYRTVLDRMTPNRLTFIGWNAINIGILAWLLWQQWRARREDWLPALHATFAAGMVPYVIWVLFTLLALPWLFRFNPGEFASLPARVQQVAYEEPYPILLKCSGSPHIFLLEDGSKRWVKDIDTFESMDFEWRDVEFVSCDDLRRVPDGPTIPRDAGPPPVP